MDNRDSRKELLALASRFHQEVLCLVEEVWLIAFSIAFEFSMASLYPSYHDVIFVIVLQFSTREAEALVKMLCGLSLAARTLSSTTVCLRYTI